jgi:hypothetical protein
MWVVSFTLRSLYLRGKCLGETIVVRGDNRTENINRLCSVLFKVHRVTTALSRVNRMQIKTVYIYVYVSNMLQCQLCEERNICAAEEFCTCTAVHSTTPPDPRLCSVGWKDDYWTIICRGIRRKRLWHNQGVIPALAWKDWGKPLNTSHLGKWVSGRDSNPRPTCSVLYLYINIKNNYIFMQNYE